MAPPAFSTQLADRRLRFAHYVDAPESAWATCGRYRPVCSASAKDVTFSDGREVVNFSPLSGISGAGLNAAGLEKDDFSIEKMGRPQTSVLAPESDSPSDTGTYWWNTTA